MDAKISFVCRCGARTLRHSGNVNVTFPKGVRVTLCDAGCPQKKAVRREADEAWAVVRATQKARAEARQAVEKRRQQLSSDFMAFLNA